MSAYTQANVVRIDVAAIASGIAIAGSVPNTKSRMMSAPRAPIIVSVRTPGPLSPPWDAKTASRPVRWLCTPAGVACSSAARASSIGGKVEKVELPGG